MIAIYFMCVLCAFIFGVCGWFLGYERGRDDGYTDGWMVGRKEIGR
jgi:hypothetical protein